MLKRLNQHLFSLITLAFAVAIFFFANRLVSGSAKVADFVGLILCCSLLCIAVVADLLDGLEHKLEKWLEAKIGHSPQAGQRKTVLYSYSDQNAEAQIVAKGLTAARVTAEQIQALMAKLSWRYEQPDGTTSTFAHAFLGSFYLVTGHSACVSPENFDAALGMKFAREQAEGKARDKLWELEGYKLACNLQGAQA